MSKSLRSGSPGTELTVFIFKKIVKFSKIFAAMGGKSCEIAATKLFPLILTSTKCMIYFNWINGLAGVSFSPGSLSQVFLVL